MQFRAGPRFLPERAFLGLHPPGGVCIMEKKTDQEGFEMLVVVQNGTLSPEEQAYYVRRVTEKFPRGVVEKVVLDVGEEYVDIRYTLHCFRDLRKMGGYCIGDPADWNPAKQAELRDTVPNWVDP